MTDDRVYSFRTPEAIAAYRKQLRRAGFSPLPLVGKKPVQNEWQKFADPSESEIDLWTRTYSAAENTGALTKFAPALDIDILDHDAAEAVERLVRDRFEESGVFLVRFGRSPKRAVLFRAEVTFSKILVKFAPMPGTTEPDKAEKLELLCDGQQIVVDGIHPDTRRAYSWHGGKPGEIKREDLPYLSEEDANALVADCVKLLVDNFGYKQASKPKARRQKQGDAEGEGADDPADWSVDYSDHDQLAATAMKLARSGMNPGAVKNFLRAQVSAAAGVDPDRLRRRLNEIPGMVDSAAAKIAEAAAGGDASPPPAPTKLEEVAAAFNKWLVLKDLRPVYAALGAVAANLLPGGDPVWLGIVAPPSTAKTEVLNALSRIPRVRSADGVTMAGLLSGTPKGQKAAGAKGGLLREVGDRGILTLKDFGSILSMRPDAKAELLAALRQIFDGEWSRTLGSDGGKTLSWRGRVGLIFGSTQAYDDHYKSISQLGDRFLIFRLDPAPGAQQFKFAFDHIGEKTKEMRDELAEKVAALFVDIEKRTQRVCNEAERDRLAEIVKLAVYLRAHVEREGYTHEIVNIHRPEGPGRLGLMLERLLVGLDAIGLDREAAFELVEAIAMDCCPPLRRQAYDLLSETEEQTTRVIADAMGLPTMSARRILEDLAAQGLAIRRRGKADDKAKEKDLLDTADDAVAAGEKKGGMDLWRVNPDWAKSWAN